MNEEYLRALTKLTKVASVKVLEATIEYLVHGGNQTVIGQKHGVEQPSIARLAKRLTELDEQIQELQKLRDK